MTSILSLHVVLVPHAHRAVRTPGDDGTKATTSASRGVAPGRLVEVPKEWFDRPVVASLHSANTSRRPAHRLWCRLPATDDCVFPCNSGGQLA